MIDISIKTGIIIFAIVLSSLLLFFYIVNMYIRKGVKQFEKNVELKINNAKKNIQNDKHLEYEKPGNYSFEKFVFVKV